MLSKLPFQLIDAMARLWKKWVYVAEHQQVFDKMLLDCLVTKCWFTAAQLCCQTRGDLTWWCDSFSQ
jgi:hypothetical protein